MRTARALLLSLRCVWQMAPWLSRCWLVSPLNKCICRWTRSLPGWCWIFNWHRRVTCALDFFDQVSARGNSNQRTPKVYIIPFASPTCWHICRFRRSDCIRKGHATDFSIPRVLNESVRWWTTPFSQNSLSVLFFMAELANNNYVLNY